MVMEVVLLIFTHLLTLSLINPLVTGDIFALNASSTFDEKTSKVSAPATLPPLFDMSDAPILNLAGNNDRDPSVQISKYLVKGWALLDEVTKMQSLISHSL